MTLIPSMQFGCAGRYGPCDAQWPHVGECRVALRMAGKRDGRRVSDAGGAR